MEKTKKCSCYAAVVIALVVLLRIGVGWHFLYEGLWKTVPSNGFSAKGFLGMAKGPTKDFYYSFLPDLGGEERLQMAEVMSAVVDENGLLVKETRKRIGWTFPVIEKEWFAYYNAYRAKYGLIDDPDRLKEARKIFDQYVLSLREYALENREDIRAFVASKRRFEERLASTKNEAEYQRIRDWDAQLEYRNEGEKFANEPVKMGENLELDLWNVLSEDQKKIGAMPTMSYGANRNGFMRWAASLPCFNKFAKPSTMGLLDLTVTVGLSAIGLCLMLGFCSRLAALGGACFMLNVVLSQYPWPTVYPYPSDMIGHSMIFNKDSIEFLILLLLAAVPCGRWGGLDWFLWHGFGKNVCKWLGCCKDDATVDGACPECCR